MSRNEALGLILSLLTLNACLSPSGDTPQEKIASALEMRDKALAAVYEEDPDVKADVEKSVGYLTLSNFSIHPGLISFATGYGVLVNKLSGKNTHVKWHRLTIGPGLAVKGLYVVAVFHDQELMERFEDGKWTAGGQAEASFVFGDFGGALDAGWIFNRKVDLHYVTHTGVALELELFGVGKVSEDKKLNRAASP
jgi:lipid-binding SYLF domain-containing protein